MNLKTIKESLTNFPGSDSGCVNVYIQQFLYAVAAEALKDTEKRDSATRARRGSGFR
jgi:hypothetical protein